MEEKVIRIFEDKLERLRDMKFIGKAQESEEINLVLDYWREIVVSGLNEREKLLKDMLADKEKNITLITGELSSIKTAVANAEHKNMALENSIELQKLMQEKEKVVLESSYKDKYEERLKKKEIEILSVNIDMERLKMEKENLEHTQHDKEERLKLNEREYVSYKEYMEKALRKKDEQIDEAEKTRENLKKLKSEKEDIEKMLQEKKEQLITKTEEYNNFKQNIENTLKKKEERIEELQQAKIDLEETIELISRSRINTWVRQEKVRMENQQYYTATQPEAADTERWNQEINQLKEKIKAIEKEKEEIENKLGKEKDEIADKIAKEYEEKSQEEVEKQIVKIKAGQKNRLIKALDEREKARAVSLADLARGFVHRIRNVFGIVTGATQLCQAEIEKCKSDPKEFIREIKNKQSGVIDELLENFSTITLHLDEAAKGADEFLKVTQIPALIMQSESLNSVIEEVCFGFDERCKEADIKVTKNLDGNIPDFLMDKKFIKDAFYNIILNSIESIKESGTVTVETKFEEESEKVVVKISDNGEGIPKQRLSKVFQIFCTSKKDRKGTGLALARRYIETHLGSVKLESEKDIGSTAAVTLPVIKEK